MNLPRIEQPGATSENDLALPRAPGLRRWLLTRLLSRITVGRLTVVLPDGERLQGGPVDGRPQAMVSLKTWRALRRVLLGGDVGLAEAYRDGDVETPDLTTLIELCARNDASLREIVSGIWPVRLYNRARHVLRANTRSGSRRNIMAHYDLGNAFYGLWLDAGMTYSSALYETAADSLEAAQERKLDRIVAMLDLSGGEHVLEIGCGWGALAERLAREGCRVTALTLSPAQRDATERRLAAAGLSDRVDIRLQDYRDVPGQFDRIVSIEMIEAVGKAYWPSYFATLSGALRPDGRVVLQAITIDESVFESYQRGTDFIQRYVFPGGCLPSMTAIEDEARAARLRLEERFAFGASYGLTLDAWRTRFLDRWHEIAALGFDEAFRRMWEFYLCYCEAGFRAGTIDVRLLALRPVKAAASWQEFLPGPGKRA